MTIDWYAMAKLDPERSKHQYKVKEVAISNFLKDCGVKWYQKKSRVMTEDEIIEIIRLRGCTSLDDARQELEKMTQPGITSFYPFLYAKKIQDGEGIARYQICKGIYTGDSEGFKQRKKQ